MRDERTSQGAFTLIELLIVMGLIALLVAALAPNLLMPGREGKRAETLARMQHLELCIRVYTRKNGYYPPSSFANAHKTVKVKNNGTNEGIECLMVHIHRQSLGRTATLEDKMDWLKNTDNDDGGFLISLLQTSKLFEVVDAWGRPIAYFREDSYGQRQNIVMGGEDQEQETVRALQHSINGVYLSPRAFQLISAGEDGVFGSDDDISIPPRRAPAQDKTPKFGPEIAHLAKHKRTAVILAKVRRVRYRRGRDADRPDARQALTLDVKRVYHVGEDFLNLQDLCPGYTGHNVTYNNGKRFADYFGVKPFPRDSIEKGGTYWLVLTEFISSGQWVVARERVRPK